MNARSNLGLFMALGFVLVLPLAHAEEPAVALRAAVTKGLGFIAKEGNEWIENKNCNSCHHLPEMLWSHREAKRRGFVVDQAQYDGWLAWAEPKVKNISAGREGVAFMTLALPDTPAAEAGKIIMEGRQNDGTWKPAAQLLMQRRDAAEAQLHATRLFLMALAGSEARVKAADWMSRQAATPAQSIETVAFQALYAQRFGLAEEAAKAATDLMQRQREDGGWSWMTGDPQSDALATGEALYALHQAGAEDVGTKAAIQRAEQWLIRTQAADGSWPIQVAYYSKHDRSGPDKAKSLKQATEIYAYWAAAWGTLGLLHGVPVKEVASP